MRTTPWQIRIKEKANESNLIKAINSSSSWIDKWIMVIYLGKSKDKTAFNK